MEPMSVFVVLQLRSDISIMHFQLGFHIRTIHVHLQLGFEVSIK